MTTAEKDCLKALTRKLSRIATELIELSTTIQDIEGTQYKESHEKLEPLEIIVREGILHDDHFAMEDGTPARETISGSVSKSYKRTEKIQKIYKRIAALERIAATAANEGNDIEEIKTRSTIRVLKGHLKREMNTQQEIEMAAKKLPKTEATWKSAAR